MTRRSFCIRYLKKLESGNKQNNNMATRRLIRKRRWKSTGFYPNHKNTDSEIQKKSEVML